MRRTVDQDQGVGQATDGERSVAAALEDLVVAQGLQLQQREDHPATRAGRAVPAGQTAA